MKIVIDDLNNKPVEYETPGNLANIKIYLSDGQEYSVLANTMFNWLDIYSPEQMRVLPQEPNHIILVSLSRRQNGTP
jgi:hypothetical protein